MRRERRDFYIECFYCCELFIYQACYAGEIRRAYCKKQKCQDKYFKDFKKNGLDYAEYREHLENEKNRLQAKKDEIIESILSRKNGKLFKGDIEIGEILEENDKFVYVQKFFWETPQLYRKRNIKLI